MMSGASDHMREDVARLRRTVGELTFLAHLARITASALDRDDLCELVISQTCRALGVAVCSLYVVQDGSLVLQATNGLNPTAVGFARMPIGTGIVGSAARDRVVIPLADAAADPRFHRIDGIDQERFTAMCAVPVVSAGARVVGVLAVQREDRHEWTDDEVETLTAIASQLAGIIERSELQRRVEAELTVQHEATARWRRLSEARNDLLSIVSHDVRTPLSIALTYVEALRERLEGVELSVVEQISTELGHVHRMVDTILSALAVESGVLPLKRRDADLAALILEACAGVQTIAPQTTITAEVGTGATIVHIDTDQLRQVVHNLLQNAVRHAPPGTAVEVRLRVHTDHVEVAVSDHGPGVDPADREEIFERFRRGGHSGGTGLGLFVVRTIVEAHGGRVAVEDAPGGGARFILRLPLLPGRPAPGSS